ncbi:PaaI family thioesterase [Arthrobacter sp. fls2-241-R2A-200]|uniref:PaaI family thioesterase n=1 Tax=Arthrobacter sp. fls2-241-R2A-200 TaxID=3040281 RepID=UPI003305D4E4
MQVSRFGSFPLAVQSNLNFLSNSLVGPVIATARPLRVGRSTIVASVEVGDAHGKLLVASTFTYLSKSNKRQLT